MLPERDRTPENLAEFRSLLRVIVPIAFAGTVAVFIAELTVHDATESGLSLGIVILTMIVACAYALYWRRRKQ